MKGAQKCAVTNRGADERGFIDTRNVLTGWDQPVFISVAAAEEMGKLIGMVSQEQIREYVAHIERMGEEIHELRELNNDLNAHKELTERIGERVAA